MNHDLPMLEANDVTKQFGRLVANHRVSLKVFHAEIVGLIGPNGAGKTTLFNIVSGYLKPEEGEILFSGKPIRGFKPNLVARSGLVRTFQIARPFRRLTVLENVTVGALCNRSNVHKARDAARDAISVAGLEARMGKPASTLTAGQLKQLEVARALACNPKLILLDEVMAGLNPREVMAMMRLVEEVRKRGVTVFWIEHVMAAVMKLADRVYVLHHGEKIAEGKPTEVARDPQVIKAYLGEEFLHARGE